MKNNIYNPLFESLLKKVNDYENPQGISEQDGAVKGTIFSDYMKAMSQLGAKLVAQYANAIQTYPKTPVKTEYMNTFIDKLKAIENSIDITKTPGVQLDELFVKVKEEATAFFGLGAKEDKRLVKHLEPWRDSFRTGFQLYTQAFKSLKEYVGKQEAAGQAKIDETTEKPMMKAAVGKFIASLSSSFEKNKTITDTKWGEPVVGESLNVNNSVVERLIQNKICVDFNTFNTVINEAKEDRVARRAARAIRPNIETLQGNLANVLNQIGGRLGDPAKANFKSLAMAPEFNKIANTLVSIQDELSVDKAELKNVAFDDLNKQVDNLVDLFNSKKKSYDETYAEEEKSLRTSKTLEVATPEVSKFITDGDAQFAALSDLAQKGANLFSADIEKEKSDKAQADKVKGESQPKNPGKKDGEIQKGQDGLDYKWDAKTKTWSRVEVEETVTSDIKIEAPIKKGTKSDQVKPVQELIIKKMKGKLANDPIYKKFAKFGADGKFGNSTAELIIKLKGGFGLTDKSSDITQELVNELSAVKESFVFEGEFNMDAYNKAGSGEGGGGKSGPRKTTQDDVKNARKELSNNSKEILAAAPAVSADTIKKQIDDAIGKAKEEWNKEQAIKELTEIGATKNPDYGKDGQMAIATSLGFRFFSNNVAIRLFDKMTGIYDIKNNNFVGKDGSKDKLSVVMKSGIPSKYSKAFAEFNNDPAGACKRYLAWKDSTISILNKAFEITYRKSLDKHLANKLSSWYGSVNTDIDAFRKKFASVLS